MTSEITGRVLTYAEFELDYFRSTTFESVTNGAFPDRWSLSTGVTGVNLTGVIDADFPSGKGIDAEFTAAPNVGVISFDPIPLIENVTCLALLKRTSAAGALGIVLRAVIGGADDYDGYAVILDNNMLFLYKVTNGVGTVLTSIDFPIDTNDVGWVRADAITTVDNTVLVRAKAWVGTAGDEPAFFTASAEDLTSPHLDAGLNGLVSDTGTFSWRCGYFRVRAYFGEQTQLYRHVTPASFVPSTPNAVPDLLGVSTKPTELDIGQSIGQRAQVTLNFRDHRESDFGEGYDSGTKYGKLRNRDLFRRGRPVRVINTLEGKEFFDATTEEFDAGSEFVEIRNYVLESFDGPTREGGFSILAQDVLKFASDDRSQAPLSSNGFLANDLAAGVTTFDVLPSGIGDLEYEAEGFIAVGGKEIMGFTRVGDTFSVLRGQLNTEDQDHSSEDRVQMCLGIFAETAAEVISGLLTTYAGVDPDLINNSEWDLEMASYLPFLYTRLIAEPVGVAQLVTEMIQQAGLILWHDPVDNQIRLRVIRSSATVFSYDETNIDQGTLQVREQPNKQVTQVWTYYGVRNPLEPLDEPTNYRSSLATVDSETESAADQSIIKKIFATWIPDFGRSAAERVNNVNIGRFSKAPRRFSFDVLRHSGVRDPQLADVIGVQWWGNQDELGTSYSSDAQIIRVEPTADRFRVDAEEMFFSSLFDAELTTNRVITIDNNINNVDLHALHNLLYPEVTDEDLLSTNPVTITFIVSEGVFIGSEDPNLAAMFLDDNWPVGLQITIINNGLIQGMGGDGGKIDIGDPTNTDGSDGTNALTVLFPVELQNNGAIWGGGGGGGAGITLNLWASGGGGSGNIPGDAGVLIGNSGSLGSPGTPFDGGAGGSTGGGSVRGGDGGDPGQSGGNGTGSGSGSVTPGVGGDPGSAIDGVSFVTFNPFGEIQGGLVG